MALDVEPAPDLRSRRWDRARLVLAVVWLLVGLAALVLHESATTLDGLYADVRSGDVAQVRLVGGLSAYGPERGTGSAQLEAHWRSGHRRHVVEVVEVAGDPASSVDGTPTRDDVGAVLRRLDPHLRVERRAYESGWGTTVLCTRLPGFFVPVVLVTGLASILLLALGPEPWRATRWAWFWLLTVPGAVLALCLLAGPAPGLPVPRTRRRLTGGWAFLLSTVLGGAFAGSR